MDSLDVDDIELIGDVGLVGGVGPVDVDEPDDVDEFESAGMPRLPAQRVPVDDPRPVADARPVEDEQRRGLDEGQRRMLDFERQWWRRPGAKEQAIRDRLGISATRYYQQLNRLLDDPAALAYDPVLVKRLRRLRASATRARSGGRIA